MGAAASGGEGPGSLKQTVIGGLHAVGYLRGECQGMPSQLRLHAW